MKLIFRLSVLCSAFHLYAQTDDYGVSLELFNPVNDVQIHWFNIDLESVDNHNVKDRSFAVGSKFYYNLNRDAQIRLRTGVTVINIVEYQDITSSEAQMRVVDVGHGKQTKLHIAPGFGWNLSKNDFQITGGFEIPFTLHNKFKFHWDYTEYTTSYTEPSFDYDFDLTIPSGFSIGVGAYFGFVYNFEELLSIGAEFSPSLIYGKYGGKVETSDYYSIYQWEQYYTLDEYKGGVFNENRFSLSVYFRIK